MLFLDRQSVLQVLYEHIQDKSKVQTRKRVDHVKLEENGVVVTTTDGALYTGDIVVGADGIHSNVRSEMWRNGDAFFPGYFFDYEPTCKSIAPLSGTGQPSD
jgi:2-polyprenyl-6-methoxyphenol hydroxylase-like FAD-dependent oxidoreductase